MARRNTRQNLHSPWKQKSETEEISENSASCVIPIMTYTRIEK
jgi:hypothetical protein